VKRLYKQAELVPREGTYGIALDGRPAKTPGKRDLTVPTGALAAAIAEEWNAQEGEVRPATMPLTRLATTTLDRVATQRKTVVQQTANYAGTDLLCYRAGHPPALAARQQSMWQPLIDCGSLVLGLALLEGRIDAAEAFAASQLDESFQIEAWGEDPEQLERRRALAADIQAAARFVSLLREG